MFSNFLIVAVFRSCVSHSGIILSYEKLVLYSRVYAIEIFFNLNSKSLFLKRKVIGVSKNEYQSLFLHFVSKILISVSKAFFNSKLIP